MNDRKEPKNILIVCMVSKSTRERLKYLAVQEKRSVKDYCRTIIEKHIRKIDDEDLKN